MATRIWLRLNDATNKCFFNNVQYRRPNIQLCRSFKPVRNFKFREVEKEAPVEFNNNGPVSYRFWKTFGFTMMFSGTCIVGATIWEYENIRRKTYNIINFMKHRQVPKRGFRAQAEQWWRSLSPGEKIFIPICFLNVLVYLAWKVPSFRKTMGLYFTASPVSSKVGLPLLLSTFSHDYFLHLAVNMYVLHNLCEFSVQSLGTEQFMAMYLISGVFGSFLSHLYKATLWRTTASLGSSAAVMGVLAYTCSQFPSLQFSLIFLPMFKFTSSQAIQGVIALDLIGAIMRWRFIDHAAHLGGAFIGILWAKWINENIWLQRKPLLTMWHKFREPPRSN
ncbi:presenilins-associated rhomboid-like protein, mitochondrial [Leptopilina boulardi]|uniref:presenilins-associated rhomboid-like protein, mitochondrial n=1 Tax=Leptopilina boulardi TaxID=63433 RepID=UPI0021F62AAA|nr:presenilins-associated rhomboid-like protein, mitochondrial [Leptopilina boulardi]